MRKSYIYIEHPDPEIGGDIVTREVPWSIADAEDMLRLIGTELTDRRIEEIGTPEGDAWMEDYRSRKQEIRDYIKALKQELESQTLP